MDSTTKTISGATLEYNLKIGVTSEIPDSLDEALQMVQQISAVAEKHIGTGGLAISRPDVYPLVEAFIRTSKASGCINASSIKSDFTNRTLNTQPHV
jgi:hypothetical protein